MNPSRPASSSEVEAVELSFQGEKLDRNALKKLKEAARSGDGEAAYRLQYYYGITERNDRLSTHYKELALKLEYPPALYWRAVQMWEREEHPDVEEVYRLAKRAEELGFKDQREGFWEEVSEARASGVIPAQSKFRFFPKQ